jgi:hypothetical protein
VAPHLAVSCLGLPGRRSLTAAPSAPKKSTPSVKPIRKDDNQADGLILKSHYAKNRIIDGMYDGFIVKIVT